MAIYVECPSCRRLNSTRTSHCRNQKCLEELPTRQRAYWIGFYQGGKERRERLGRVDRKTAEDWERKRRLEVREGKYFERPASVMLPKLLDDYLAMLENRGARSVKSARSMIATMKAFFGNCDATEVNAYAYREALLKKHSHKYVDNHLTCLRAAFNHYGKIENPVNGKMFLRPDSRRFGLLDSEQLIKLIQVIQEKAPHIYVLTVLAVNTGLRQNNVFRLRRDEVDLENKLIRVTQKGDRRLTIPMNNTVHSLLMELPDNGTEWLIVNPKTQRPYTWIRRSWKSCLKAAGVPETYWWHDLRKQFATTVTLATGNAKITQDLLGHTQLSTTLIYLNLPSEEARKAVEELCP